MNLTEIMHTIREENLKDLLLDGLTTASELAEAMGASSPSSGDEEVDALIHRVAARVWDVMTSGASAYTVLYRMVNDKDAEDTATYNTGVYGRLANMTDALDDVRRELAGLAETAPEGTLTHREAQATGLDTLARAVERITDLGIARTGN